MKVTDMDAYVGPRPAAGPIPSAPRLPPGTTRLSCSAHTACHRAVARAARSRSWTPTTTRTRSPIWPPTAAPTACRPAPPRTAASGRSTRTAAPAIPKPDSGWAAEISLDLDMVSAACPNCHILLVEASIVLPQRPRHGGQQAVSLGAKFVSNSYGGGRVVLGPQLRPPVLQPPRGGDHGVGGGQRLRRVVSRLVPVRHRRRRHHAEAEQHAHAAAPRPRGETPAAGAPDRAAPLTTPNRRGRPTPAAQAHRRRCRRRRRPRHRRRGLRHLPVRRLGGLRRHLRVLADHRSHIRARGDPGRRHLPVHLPVRPRVGAERRDVRQQRNLQPGLPVHGAGAGYDGPTGLGTPNGATAFANPDRCHDGCRETLRQPSWLILGPRSGRRRLFSDHTPTPAGSGAEHGAWLCCTCRFRNYFITICAAWLIPAVPGQPVMIPNGCRVESGLAGGTPAGCHSRGLTGPAGGQARAPAGG